MADSACSEAITLAFCWAHPRRKFFDIAIQMSGTSVRRFGRKKRTCRERREWVDLTKMTPSRHARFRIFAAQTDHFAPHIAGRKFLF
jgi:hypothetical protein